MCRLRPRRAHRLLSGLPRPRRRIEVHGGETRLVQQGAGSSAEGAARQGEEERTPSARRTAARRCGMSAFLEAMCAKWSEFGNVLSPALRHVWNQIQATVDYQSGPDALDVWPVIPAELGAGKSTAAKVWCAVNKGRGGVLIVVRTKDQADEYARDINAWSGDAGRA